MQGLATHGYLHTVLPHGIYAGLSQESSAALAHEFLLTAVLATDDSLQSMAMGGTGTGLGVGVGPTSLSLPPRGGTGFGSVMFAATDQGQGLGAMGASLGQEMGLNPLSATRRGGGAGGAATSSSSSSFGVTEGDRAALTPHTINTTFLTSTSASKGGEGGEGVDTTPAGRSSTLPLPYTPMDHSQAEPLSAVQSSSTSPMAADGQLLLQTVGVVATRPHSTSISLTTTSSTTTRPTSLSTSSLPSSHPHPLSHHPSIPGVGTGSVNTLYPVNTPGAWSAPALRALPGETVERIERLVSGRQTQVRSDRHNTKPPVKPLTPPLLTLNVPY